MFPVKCKDLLPLDHLVIKSVSVRGALGPLTVWVSNEDQNRPGGGERRVRLNPAFWTKLFDKRVAASRRTYKELVLDKPIKLRPGETKVIYIHSTLPSDEAIVYDNSYYGMTAKRYEDDNLAILTGRAHVSTHVFGQEPIWGWGNAWRDRREFVGRLDYGTVYKLWQPVLQRKFGSNFQDCARCLSLCQRRWESPISMLPDECIYFILNMCRWDWFDDDSDAMKVRRQREKTRLRAEQTEETQRQAAAVFDETTEEDQQPAAHYRAVMDTDDEDGDYALDQDNSSEDEDMNEEEEEVDSDNHAWSEDEDDYDRANIQSFSYQDMESDDDQDDEGHERAELSRRNWIRQQFARIHVLRALASAEDRGYVEY
jgi:hypothetical protein